MAGSGSGELRATNHYETNHYDRQRSGPQHQSPHQQQQLPRQQHGSPSHTYSHIRSAHSSQVFASLGAAAGVGSRSPDERSFRETSPCGDVIPTRVHRTGAGMNSNRNRMSPTMTSPSHTPPHYSQSQHFACRPCRPHSCPSPNSPSRTSPSQASPNQASPSESSSRSDWAGSMNSTRSSRNSAHDEWNSAQVFFSQPLLVQRTGPYAANARRPVGTVAAAAISEAKV